MSNEITLREWLAKQEPEQVRELMRAIVAEFSTGPFSADDDGTVREKDWGAVTHDLDPVEAKLVAAVLNWQLDQPPHWMDGDEAEMTDDPDPAED